MGENGEFLGRLNNIKFGKTDIDKTYTYRKSRTASDEQRKQARQRRVKLNFAENCYFSVNSLECYKGMM
ncbi:hypothetical protein AALB53_20555 [Lachnospiraceae bacterium 47-T17]